MRNFLKNKKVNKGRIENKVIQVVTMKYKEPAIFKNYTMQLMSIVREDPNYWLERNKQNHLIRGHQLWVECIDRYYVPLGSVKNQLLSARVPTQETLIRRFRKLVENSEVENKIRELKEKERQGTL